MIKKEWLTLYLEILCFVISNCLGKSLPLLVMLVCCLIGSIATYLATFKKEFCLLTLIPVLLYWGKSEWISVLISSIVVLMNLWTQYEIRQDTFLPFLFITSLIFGYWSLNHGFVGLALMYVLTGILLNRSLYFENERMSKDYSLFNVLSLLVSATLILLVSMPRTLSLILSLFKWIYLTLVLPLLKGILTIILYALYPLFYLFEKVSGNLNLHSDVLNGLMDFEPFEVEIEETSTQSSSIWILYILGGLIGIVLVYLLIQKLIKRSTDKSSIHGQVSEVRESIRPKKEKNVNEVRKSFRQYLSLLKKKGVTFETDFTSLDMAKKGYPVFESKEKIIDRLRSFYLKARYDSDPTQMEIQEAKNCLKELKQK